MVRASTFLIAVFLVLATVGVSAADTGAAASFYSPQGVAVDARGNVYVADSLNYTIRKITPAGVVTTLAGKPGVRGNVNGTGAAASFDLPAGVAVDPRGNIYVADANNTMIRKITPAGVVTTLAGRRGMFGAVNGTGTAATFFSTKGVAVDASGNVYVADDHEIRKITPAGVVTTLAGGTGAEGASVVSPKDVAADASGNVYFSAGFTNSIRKVTPTGVVTTLAGGGPESQGDADGKGAAASFSNPLGVAVDARGNVYVADNNNNAIRKITPSGVVTTLAGGGPGSQGDADGKGAAASFLSPEGVAVDAHGNVYVADTGNNAIREITPAGVVTTLAGGGAPGHTDGHGTLQRH